MFQEPWLPYVQVVHQSLVLEQTKMWKLLSFFSRNLYILGLIFFGKKEKQIFNSQT